MNNFAFIEGIIEQLVDWSSRLTTILKSLVALIASKLTALNPFLNRHGSWLTQKVIRLVSVSSNDSLFMLAYQRYLIDDYIYDHDQLGHKH